MLSVLCDIQLKRAFCIGFRHHLSYSRIDYKAAHKRATPTTTDRTPETACAAPSNLVNRGRLDVTLNQHKFLHYHRRNEDKTYDIGSCLYAAINK